MAKDGIIKVENRSVPILYFIVIIPLLIAILDQFNIINLARFITPVITILSALFVMSEVGVMGMLRAKRLGKDPIRVFGALVAGVAILSAALTLAGIEITFLQTIGGIVNILVIIYVIMEGFR